MMADVKPDAPSAEAEATKTDATAVPEEAGFQSASRFALPQRRAALLAASTIVPDTFRGNVPNCVIALNMANRMGADPLMVMQNLYIVYGRPSWSAVFLISTFNQCGKFTALRYEWQGAPGQDEWGCRAYAVERSTGERLIGSLVTIGLSKAEGWYDRKDRNGNFVSKWRTIPEQMLMYRSASFFIKTHAPELAMGLPTTEENEDRDRVIDITPTGTPNGPVVVTPDTLLGGLKTEDVTAGSAAGEDSPADPPTPASQVAAAVKAASQSTTHEQGSLLDPKKEGR